MKRGFQFWFFAVQAVIGLVGAFQVPQARGLMLAYGIVMAALALGDELERRGE